MELMENKKMDEEAGTSSVKSTKKADKNDEKKNNMTSEQCDAIIDFMKAHSKFAAGQAMGCDPQNTKNELMKKLTTLVCSKGPVKTDKQITDCWKYMKRKAKKYHADKKKWNKKTGNDTGTNFPIVEKYEKVLQVIGTEHGLGLELTQEDGFQHGETNIARVKVEGGSVGDELIIVDTAVTGTRKRKMEPTSISIKPKATSTVVSSDVHILQSPTSSRTSYGSYSNKKHATEQISESTVIGQVNNVGSISNSSQPSSQKHSPQVLNTRLPLTPKHSVVYTCTSEEMKKETPQTPQSQYAEQFKQYMTMYKNKPSKTQVRSEMAINSINEGNTCMKSLIESVQELKNVSVERNALVNQQNNFLRQLLALKEDESIISGKENTLQ